MYCINLLYFKFLQKCNDIFEFSTIKSMFQLYIKYQIANIKSLLSGY